MRTNLELVTPQVSETITSTTLSRVSASAIDVPVAVGSEPASGIVASTIGVSVAVSSITTAGIVASTIGVTVAVGSEPAAVIASCVSVAVCSTTNLRSRRSGE